MNNLDTDIDKYLQAQGINNFFHRLSIAIKSSSVYTVAEASNISRSTLYQYLNEASYPDIARLAAIAENTGYSISWLLFGNKQEQIKIKNKGAISCLLIPDDSMTPTLPEGAEVVYQTLTPTPDTPVFDGIYVIATARGNLVRRLQWREDDKEYLILCSNVDYPSQTMKNVNIIGKVTAVMTAI